jgi:hypothetical protein
MGSRVSSGVPAQEGAPRGGREGRREVEVSKPAGERYTVAVDFDGVLHSYTSPWVNAHTIPDRPVPGALLWLHSTLQKFDVVIYSTRCRTWRGRRAVRAWLRDRGLEDVRLSYEKPAALVYIDARAWRFEGTFPTADQIHRAKPWNKR